MLRLVPFDFTHLDGVRQFNSRLREGGVAEAFLLPETAPDSAALGLNGLGLDGLGLDAVFCKRQFLALEDREVRGGFLLQDQQFWVAGQPRLVGNIQMPVSLGLVDRNCAGVAGQMMRLLLARRPLLFAVGMGSRDAVFARLLAAMRFRVTLVPFRYHVSRPARFLREIRTFHRTAGRSALARLAAASGLGAVGLWALQAGAALSEVREIAAPGLRGEAVAAWGEWADAAWQRYRDSCSLAGLRDRATLPAFHDLARPEFQVFMLHSGRNRPVGWVALQRGVMRDNQHFGNLVVGTLLDGVVDPGYEAAAVRFARRKLGEGGADLIVCNHQHRQWLRGLCAAGFLGGPSNYVLALSPELHKALREVDSDYHRLHISRADGDGRIHL